MLTKPVPRSAIAIVAAFLMVSVVAPLPYAIIEPGGGRNVLDKTIRIPTEKTYPTTGKLLLTTVYATSPESTLFAGNVLRGWYFGDSIVIPREAIYPRQSSPAQITAKNTKEMVDSQQDSAAAALTYLGYKVGIEYVKDAKGQKIAKLVFPFEISITLKNTGGPSGGLIFALGIVEKLTPKDLLSGRVVAGSGTINKSGKVGGIGGIEEKLIAARRAGATVFLASSENCKDIENIPSGIKVYSVATLKEAVSVLENSENAIPHCTWQKFR